MRLLAVLLIACGHDAPAVQPSPLEATIAKDLGARFGVDVTAACFVWDTVPLACRARLADGTQLPIQVRDAGAAWEWWIEGTVVPTAPVAAYIRGELAELGVAEDVRCSPSVRVIAPGERIECALTGGGKAFATIGADGTTTVELALDPAAAAARSEPRPDRELEERSRALELTDDTGAADEQDDKAAPPDAGSVLR